MRRPLLIVNPFASGVDPARTAAVAAALGDVDVVRTEARGHATELVREAAGRPALYVFSGDGGYNEALNGLDADVPVGFVPGGAASVLPRALGLPRDPVAAARKLVAGRTRRIALGRVNGRRFAFAAGIGLDAEAVRRVDALGRTEHGRIGNLRFGLVVAALVLERRARFEPELEVEGHGRAAFALVTNGDPYTYAGRLPLHVSPHARFEGGLDLLAPRRVTPASVPQLLRFVFTGRGSPDAIRLHDADRIEIRAAQPLPLQADGEDLGDADNVLFEAEREAVRVLV